MDARAILLVDDDPQFRSEVRATLGRVYRLVEAASEADFREIFSPYSFGLVILDMRLEKAREGLGLLREIYACDEVQPVIMVSAYGDTESTLEAVESGALMFLHKRDFSPALLTRMVDAVLLQGRVRRKLAALESLLGDRDQPTLVGVSASIRGATRLAEDAAEDPDTIVLIEGPAGAGKKAVGQAIHGRGRTRSTGPFVAVSAHAVAGQTEERALLGGAFRSGFQRSKGLIEKALGGVLFLDGASDFRQSLIQALLEIRRSRHFQIPGSHWSVPVDVQIVLSTDLDEAEDNAWFERQLATELRVIRILVPPLRERREDIALLAGHFLQEQRLSGKTAATTLSGQVVEALECYTWPGNVRELRNVVEYAAIRADSGNQEEILTNHLPMRMLHDARSRGSAEVDYRLHIARAEVALVNGIIEEQRVTARTELAQLLGYSNRFTLLRRIRRNVEEFPQLAREFTAVGEIFGGRQK